MELKAKDLRIGNYITFTSEIDTMYFKGDVEDVYSFDIK